MNCVPSELILEIEKYIASVFINSGYESGNALYESGKFHIVQEIQSITR